VFNGTVMLVAPHRRLEDRVAVRTGNRGFAVISHKA